MSGYVHVVYTLLCHDGTLYTGYTNRLQTRLRAHKQGKGAKYTRGRRPVQLVHTRRYASKKEAMQAEYHFKQLSRYDKLQHIQQEGLKQEEGEHVDSTELS